MAPAVGRVGCRRSPKVGALIRARRRQLHMTLQELCDAAGISVGYLSQVERDHATPSLGTLAQIARSLDVGVDYFIATPSTEDGADARRRARPLLGRRLVDHLRAPCRRLSPATSCPPSSCNVPPGYRSETVSHEGEEILYVLEGAITQRLDGQEMVLTAGDSLHFRGNQPAFLVQRHRRDRAPPVDRHACRCSGRAPSARPCAVRGPIADAKKDNPPEGEHANETVQGRLARGRHDADAAAGSDACRDAGRRAGGGARTSTTSSASIRPRPMNSRPANMSPRPMTAWCSTTRRT